MRRIVNTVRSGATREQGGWNRKHRQAGEDADTAVDAAAE
jgi:hypothetical protein